MKRALFFLFFAAGLANSAAAQSGWDNSGWDAPKKASAKKSKATSAKATGQQAASNGGAAETPVPAEVPATAERAGNDRQLEMPLRAAGG